MPTYDFKNTDTNEVFEKFMSISQLEIYLEEHPNIIRHHESTSAALISGVDQKPSQGFRDILKQVKGRSGRNNTVNTF